MPSEPFFVRRSKALLRRPRLARLEMLTLEDRAVPTITGTVYQDFNANGRLDATVTVPNAGGGTVPAAIDAGVAGVTVTAYNAAGTAVNTTTTAANGKYTLTGLTAGVTYRVEFTNLPAGAVDGPHGPTGKTSVQFATDGSTNVNHGVVRAEDYSRDNPLLVSAVYVEGSQTAGLPAAATNPILPAPRPTDLGLIGFSYSAGATNQGTGQSAPTPQSVAVPVGQVGTVWGLGFDRTRGRLFASAYTKRHAGWGPGGPGAIYRVDVPASGTATTASAWLNLTAAPTGAGSLAALRAAYTDNDGYATDGGNVGWDSVGKTGLGGLDVSPDGTRLYVMNLFDRNLYVVPIDPATGNPGTPVAVPVPKPTNATGAGQFGDVRPFAVQWYRGKVYVGMVNSAESTVPVDANGVATGQGDPTQLRAYVYEFDPATNTFGASLLNAGATLGVPLNYSRGTSFGGSDDFHAWSPTFQQVNAGSGSGKYGQPMLSGLAFDAAGNLTLGLRDRGGDQNGRFLPSRPGSAALIEGVAAGDTLRAAGNPTTGWALEANGVSGGGTSGGAGNGQGPGGGEFYYQDNYGNTDTIANNGTNGHNDVSAGGVAQIPGFPDALTTAYDPFRNGTFRTGGVRWLDSRNGTVTKSYYLYQQDQNGNTFGKANGVGDLVALEVGTPAAEVGNRVWRDQNLNGVQDADEDGIGGVSVELWGPGPDGVFQTKDDAKLATVVTDNTAAAGSATRGTFYFNSGPPPTGVTPAGNEAYNVAGLTRAGVYQIRIPAGQGPLAGLVNSPFQAGGNGNRDSDAKLLGGLSVIGGAAGFTLPALVGPGGSSHALDAGFGPGLSLGNFVWNDANNSGTIDAADGANPGIDGITVNLYQAADLKTIFATTATAGGGRYLFGGLTAGDYVVEIVAPPGYRSSTGTLFNPTTGPFESGLAGNSPIDNEDHGKAVSGSDLLGFTIRTNAVTLVNPGGANPDTVITANDASLRQDFGLFKVFGLGNRVWLDKNNSGTIDAADGANPGIAGVSVRLFLPADFDAAGNLLAGATSPRPAAVTDSKGYYRFDDLPAGQYVVVADGTSAALAGFRSSTGGSSATTTFEPAATALPAYPGGVDSDDDGTTTANKQVRTGVVTLGPANNAATKEGDAPNGQGAPDDQADMTLDFGFYRPLVVGNRVFFDRDNDGRFGVADTGFDGVTVRLFRADPLTGLTVGAAVATQTTRFGGYFLFTGLGSDGYLVELDAKTLPTGVTWFSSSGTNDSLTGPFEPGPNPNTDKTDADDNGTVFRNDAAAYLIRSEVVSLSAGNAPAGEPATTGFADATPDRDSDLTLDFGFWQPLSIGNFVWEDKNNDGAVSAGEAGLGGVPVRLYRDNGDGVFNAAADALVGSTTTSAAGYYLFTLLAEGKYFVALDAPTGYRSSTGAVGKATGPFEPVAGLPADARDHGTAAGGRVVRSNLVTLAVGGAPTKEPPTPGRGTDPAADASADYTIDFGLFRPLQLGNFVWEDANNNGMFDAGEAGLDGVPVALLDAAGSVIATTTTASGGAYLFDNLVPGTYRVRVTPPAGYFTSTGANGKLTGPYEPGKNGFEDFQDHGTAAGAFVLAAPVTLGQPGNTAANPANNGFANLSQDFGLCRPLSLGNFVWEDANNNGKLDAGEAPLPGVAVTLLDAAGAVIGTTTTDAKGNYRFTNLAPGGYTVRVATPAGYATSTGANGKLTGPYEPGVNGTQDNEDHGTQAGGAAASKVTLGAPGTNPDNAGLANLRQDFGFYRPLSLGNFVWEDANNNGKLDAGEAPLPGIAVTLLDAAGGTVGTTTTDANGNYLFTNLAPGGYTVRVTIPAGYASSTGANGKATGPYEPGVGGNQDNQDHGTQAGGAAASKVALGAPGANPDSGGLANLRQDFGLFRPLSLGNFVWGDLDNNGKLDAGEAGLPNVPVELLDAAGAVIGTSATDAGGNYLFTNLVPGGYAVRVTTPAGLRTSTGRGNLADATGPYEPGVGGAQDDEDHGTASGKYAITVATLTAPGTNPDNAGLANLRQDFGFAPPPGLSLGNFVWLDANNNGRLDSGEKGLAGVAVTLKTAAGATVAARATDANGNYLFTGLAAGAYTVTVTPPAGYRTSTGANASATGPYEPGVTGAQDGQDHGTANGSAVSTATVTLSAAGNPDVGGTANLRQDFGLFAPLSFGNTVWEDANNNGKLDAGEKVLPDVPVTLLDATGAVVATTTTGADGKYLFRNLTPGTYSVRVVPPAGATASTPVFDPLNTTDNLNIGTQAGAVIQSPPFALTPGGAPLVNGNTDPNNYVTGDFGIQPPPVPPVAQISGHVYLDPDASGTYTPGRNGDKPIGAVTITLTGIDPNGDPLPTKTTKTDVNGFYQFTGLPPGTYTIRETQPGGILIDGTDVVGTLGGTVPANDVLTATLAPDDDGLNYDFFEVLPVDPFGYVWVDLNRNCVKDPGEPGVAGVPVSLGGTAYAGTAQARPLTAADVPGGLTVLTDSTGRYQYPLMPPGSYTIDRGGIPTGPRELYADWCPQNGDPLNPPPDVTQFRFANVVLQTPNTTRGPFNFGLVPNAPTTDPTKQQFLGSTAPGPQDVVAVPPPGGPTRPAVSFDPAFTVSTGVPDRPAFVIAAAGAGFTPMVRVFDYATGYEKFRFLAYEAAFTGGVRVAQGDFDGDGTPDVVTGTGVGGGPRVRVFSGVDGSVLAEFFAYEPEFRGGLFVAAADVTGDGRADIITGTDTGGGPRVTVFDAATGAMVQNYFAFDADQRGGVRVAAADFDTDGKADVVTTAGPGVPTRVRVFGGATQAVLADYAPFEPAFTGGAGVAVGDVNGDGTPDVAITAEAGGGPRVQVLSGLTQTAVLDFYGYEPTFTGGVRGTLRDVDGDGRADVVVAPGPTGTARVRVFRATDLAPLDDFTAFDPDFVGGTYVG